MAEQHDDVHDWIRQDERHKRVRQLRAAAGSWEGVDKDYAARIRAEADAMENDPDFGDFQKERDRFFNIAERITAEAEKADADELLKDRAIRAHQVLAAPAKARRGKTAKADTRREALVAAIEEWAETKGIVVSRAFAKMIRPYLKEKLGREPADTAIKEAVKEVRSNRTNPK